MPHISNVKNTINTFEGMIENSIDIIIGAAKNGDKNAIKRLFTQILNECKSGRKPNERVVGALTLIAGKYPARVSKIGLAMSRSLGRQQMPEEITRIIGRANIGMEIPRERQGNQTISENPQVIQAPVVVVNAIRALGVGFDLVGTSEEYDSETESDLSDDSTVEEYDSEAESDLSDVSTTESVDD